MKAGEIDPHAFYVVSGEALAKVRAAMTRLHSEVRLTGDEMRDLGHSLDAVIRDAFVFAADAK